MNHTKTPWYAVKGDVLNPDRTWGIVRPLDRDALGLGPEDGQPTEVIAEVCVAEGGTDEDDAKLIVKAVNHHDELVRLLAEMTGAARFDCMDEKSNVWRSLMIDADALLKKLEN